MATQKERQGNWKSRGLDKRDFQHDHSGPEEMPHKRKQNNNKGAKRTDHKHIWETNGPETYQYYNMIYTETRFECLECGKKGNVLFNYNSKE